MRCPFDEELSVRALTRSVVLLTSAAVAMSAGVATAVAAPTQTTVAQAVSVFPSDDLTVRDRTQLTGRRVNLPLPDCAARPTDCNTVRLLNQLDGFDLDPRLALRFAAPVDPAAIAAATVVEQLGGSRDGARTGVDRVVYDAATNTVYAHPAQQLSPGTTYRLRVGNNDGNNNAGNNNAGNNNAGNNNAGNDNAGGNNAGGNNSGNNNAGNDNAGGNNSGNNNAGNNNAGNNNSGGNNGGGNNGGGNLGGDRGAVPRAQSTFTTLSATDGLTDMVRQLDNGSAYRAAGILGGSRGLQVDAAFPAAGTTMTYTRDLGSDKKATDPVPNTSVAAAGTYVFGSYLAPSWLTPDGDIPQTPTADAGPRVRGQARLPFVAILPAGPAPAGGWPVTVFGHGFTRTDADLFLAATQNAARGLATIATDVVGHGYGPQSTWNVTSAAGTTTVPAHARGVDRNRDGTIDSTEGVATLPQPARLAQINSRDGLRQTVADVGTLVRAVAAAPNLGGVGLRPTGVTYYGQSFGGIYGSMLGGVDRTIQAFGLNVPGGPISEIARLSPAFRPLVTQSLAAAQPQLLNGGKAGFTESLPLAGEPPVTSPAPGSLPIQQFLADGTWINRSGSPETYAPLLPKSRTLVQSAFGDQTVPNPTASTLIRAGGLEQRTTLYRNDKTANASMNPHGFLLDPRFVPGNELGQTQMSTFLASGGATVIDPDGPAPIFEVPVTDPAVLMKLNFVS